MRDYGKVHTSFWSSDTLRGASDDARLLALYLLSCSHSNMAGCFRLPLAYAVEDLGWDSERLSNGFKTLSELGWVKRCDKSGWTWICKFHIWNKPDNPNMRKAIGKLIDFVPGSVFFKADLSSSWGFSETVSKPLGNTPSPSPVPSLSPSPSDLPKIPLDDGTDFEVGQADLAEFKKAYPRLDIAAELGKARVWCLSNAANRKTRRGAPKFINGWLGRANTDLKPAAATRTRPML